MSDRSPEDGADGADDALARRIVAQLRATPRPEQTGGRGGRRRPTEPQSSSAGPDDRDPQPAEIVMRRWLRDAGWEDQLAAGALIARWTEIVGPEVADHATPEITDDGDLLLRADSTAWATQLGLLMPQIRRRLHEAVGSGVVGQIRIVGPTPPRRATGPRRVRGVGPRDTYG